ATLALAAAADLTEALAALNTCGADPELVALAQRCLAADPAARPRHAGEVAEAVTAYQQAVGERLRQAELGRAAGQAPPPRAQATAAQERLARAAAQQKVVAERRARRLGLTAAGLALLVVGAAWLYQAERAGRAAEAARQRSQGEREVELALEEAGRQRQNYL